MYMYIYIHIYMCVFKSVYIYIYIYTNISDIACASVISCIFLYLFLCFHVRECSWACMGLHVSMRVHACAHACLSSCVFLYHMHTCATEIPFYTIKTGIHVIM